MIGCSVVKKVQLPTDSVKNLLFQVLNWGEYTDWCKNKLLDVYK